VTGSAVIAIFESIVPIFALVLLGVALRRARFIEQGLWRGLENLGYFVLFPALLFITLYRADFAGLEVGNVAATVLVALCGFGLLVLALWPMLHARRLSASSFTTVFQTATRWNAFIALAVADKLFGAEGLALVALVMALIIIPINVMNVGVLLWFGSNSRSFSEFALKLLTNPLIAACVAGLAMRHLPFGIYPPLEEAVDLLARAALGMGLLMVGAGLTVSDALRPSAMALLPVGLKLLVFPVLIVIAGLAFGLRGETLVLIALCGAVPTAMNGYLLARQLGGDAQLYAAVTTLQTMASFFTLPLVLAIAARLA
jgi:malonate transporter and related proteins